MFRPSALPPPPSARRPLGSPPPPLLGERLPSRCVRTAEGLESTASSGGRRESPPSPTPTPRGSYLLRSGRQPRGPSLRLTRPLRVAAGEASGSFCRSSAGRACAGGVLPGRSEERLAFPALRKAPLGAGAAGELSTAAVLAKRCYREQPLEKVFVKGRVARKWALI